MLNMHMSATCMAKAASEMGGVQGNDVGAKLEYMLSTGNLQSRGGLDMSQATGFTIVAERLNFVRYDCWTLTASESPDASSAPCQADGCG